MLRHGTLFSGPIVQPQGIDDGFRRTANSLVGVATRQQIERLTNRLRIGSRQRLGAVGSIGVPDMRQVAALDQATDDRRWLQIAPLEQQVRVAVYRQDSQGGQTDELRTS